MLNKSIVNKRIFAVLLAAVITVLAAAAVIPAFTVETKAADTINVDDYVFFDLRAGQITINGSTYSGYRYDGNPTPVAVTGSVTSEQKFYVYQSNEGDTDTGIFVDGAGNKTLKLPTHSDVKVGDTPWGDYITNNSDVEDVIKKWNENAPSASRAATPNRIAVSGVVNISVVVDNVWSSFQDSSKGNTSRTTGGISYNPTTSKKGSLTIQTVGHNRFGNIFYLNGGSDDAEETASLIIEEKTAGSTLTVANLASNAGNNYWCAAIGSNDGSNHAKHIYINSGTIFAGTTEKDDCTAIGGGGNGWGIVTISGGRVTATVASSGAAIGGGIGKQSYGGPARVTINGTAEVYAYNASCTSRKNPGTTTDTWWSNSNPKVKYIPAAAIGGGSSGQSVCEKCYVTIGGNAKVYAQTVGGAAIGGGSSADTHGGAAEVTIQGNAKVTAVSLPGKIEGVDVPAGNAIGGGMGGASGNGGDVVLTVGGTAQLYAGSVGGGGTISKKSTNTIGYAEVTLKDSCFVSAQFIMAKSNKEGVCCKFNMSGGKIDNDPVNKPDKAIYLQESGGAVYMDDPNGLATMSGGEIVNCSAKSGGAVYMSGGIFELSDTGNIHDCYATEENGGAVYLGGGEFTMTGGSIHSNAAENGAAAYLAAGEMSISGGELYNNKATDNGGAVYLGGGELSVSDGNIHNNSAQNGGAAYLAAGEMSISGGELHDNKATDNGGAVYLGGSGGKLTVSGGTIRQNSADGEGGAAYVNGGNVEVYGTAKITNNSAVGNGGGVAVNNGAYSMEGGEVTLNKSTSGKGGGIYVSAEGQNVAVSILSGSVSNNDAFVSGGAFAVEGTGGTEEIAVTLGVNEEHDCSHGSHGSTTCPEIKNNTSKTSGGAIYIAGGYNAKLFIYCLDEAGNDTAGDNDNSDFMMVDGGYVELTTASQIKQEPDGDHGKGNISINTSIHVTGGRMYVDGSMESPYFGAPLTIDIKDPSDGYYDYREGDGSSYKLEYFENFKGTGLYKVYQIAHGEYVDVSPTIFSHQGYNIVGWNTVQFPDAVNPGVQYVPGADRWHFVNGGTKDTPGDLRVYAIWEILGYPITFEPGITTFGGSMPSDIVVEFGSSYTIPDCGYTYTGHQFGVWIDEDGTNYIPGQVINIYESMTFTADWVLCPHDKNEYFTIRSESNVISRSCSCGTYQKTVTLVSPGDNIKYDKNPHKVTLETVPVSTNGITPVDTWGFTDSDIVYTGTLYSEPEQLCIWADTYTARITDAGSGKFAEIQYTIHKGDQDAPATPDYTVLGNKLTVVAVPNSPNGTQTYYRLRYYLAGDEKETEWQTTLEFEFNSAFTNYFVEVYFKGNENYNDSPIKASSTSYYYDANGIIKIQIYGEGITPVMSKPATGDGVIVKLVPDSGYYIRSNAKDYFNFSCDEVDYNPSTSLGVSVHDEANNEFLVDGTFPSVTSGKNYVISINITAAIKKVTVTASITENQNFGTVAGTKATIANDSAFTAFFEVKNYEMYNGLSIKFSRLLPQNTRIIMVSNNSYWYYLGDVVGGYDAVDLKDFKNMGGTSPYEILNKDMQLRFIVDFSQVAAPLDADTEINVSLIATKIDTKAPDFPTRLVEAALEAVKFGTTSVSNGMNASLDVTYAVSDGETSKWDGRRSALVITPTTDIPKDTRLRVSLPTHTYICYKNAEGKFVISLGGAGVTSEMSIRMESDMLPVTSTAYVFDGILYASNSASGYSTLNGDEMSTFTVSFTSDDVATPSVKVEGSKTAFSKQAGEDLVVNISYDDIPLGGKVDLRIFYKEVSPDGSEKYSDTSWRLPGGDAVVEGQRAISLGFLNNNPAGMSYCLLVIVQDSVGQQVLSVPYYFVIY